ncbi:MAG: nucleotidyl transferase AbiEii/AbiGii toxin family protein [Bacteroidales bacterium]|nr:nucleotidyl transferase AbiEii/AbiGii toxin family protein [Bacteroidales bacterium]
MSQTAKTINFWEYSDQSKLDLFTKIRKEKKVSLKAAEKDWWVCNVIKAVFELRCADADALTFKGGTSLSKAWGITERFSEDVDVAIDKSFFGLSGETRSARDRIRKLSRKYIAEEVAPELSAILRVLGAYDCEVGYKTRRDSDADPTVLLVPYYSILPEDPYIKAVVKVEFSCRSPREPREMRSIRPFAAELSPLIEFPETVVPTVVPERTFLEKVFLLHEEFQKDYPRHKRMSRHLYDIYRLAKFGVADRAIADTSLYDSLVQHRSVYNAIRGIDYGGHSRERLSFVPPEHLLPLWEEDYRSMQDQFIYGESPSFPDLLKTLRTLQDRLRSA